MSVPWGLGRASESTCRAAALVPRLWHVVELVEKVGCSCSLLWRWDVEVVGEVVVGTLVRVAALLFSWVWLVLLLGGKLLERL